MKSIIFLFAFILSSQAFSQVSFEVISDATGDPFTQFELDSLEQLSDEILEIIEIYAPEISSDFKVYHNGFYLHNIAAFGSLNGVISHAIDKVTSTTSNYLLISRVIDSDKAIANYNIRFEFPTDSFICLDKTEMQSSLQVLVDRFSEGLDGYQLSAFDLESKALSYFKEALNRAFCCSASLRNSTCEQPNFLLVDQIIGELSSNEEYINGLQDLITIIAWFENCNDERWKSEISGGIVPSCFWNNMSELDPSFYYNVSDIPFQTGCIDGTAVGVRNIIKGLLAADDVVNSLIDAIDAYTLYYIRCENHEPTQEEMALIWKGLHDLNWANQSWKAIFNTLYEACTTAGYKLYSDAIDYLYGEDSNIEWCEEKLKIRNQVKVLANNLTNRAYYSGLYRSTIDSLKVLWSNVDGLSNEERYYQGCYTMIVATSIVEITESGYLLNIDDYLSAVASKFKNGSKLQSRTDFVEAITPRLVDKIKSQKGFTDLGLKGKDLINDYSLNYAGYLEISSNNLYKGYEFLWSGEKIRKNIGTLRGVSIALSRGLKEISEIVAYAADSRINSFTIEHIFRGHGERGGIHHISSLINEPRYRLIDRIKETDQGFYFAKYQKIDGSFASKPFWPDTWDEFKVVDEIKYVLDNNPISLPEGNRWEGFTSTGQKIIFTLDENNVVLSAYPAIP